VLDGEDFGRETNARFRRFLLLALMPVFFLSTGLRAQWGMSGLTVLGVAAALLVASVAGKILGVWIAGRKLGWSTVESLTIGWLLQTKALIMIIFTSVLLDKDIITPAAFAATLLMALASTMLTIPIIRQLGLVGES
jgi:Kef-type K+ transport system membrane component KefB